ncbi:MULTISPECIES: transposase [Streptomyces]|uniref:Transposase n=2 Tax=Streptomyces TaxID=1883 RepID=A0ABV9J9F2_9ACTN
MTAFGPAVEVGDWYPFTGATISSYLGLVPSDASSCQRRAQGPITKTGNSHARRLLLVEASWHHRKRYRPSQELMRRQASQPPAVRDRAERGNRCLNQPWKRFDARDKRPTIAAVAVACLGHPAAGAEAVDLGLRRLHDPQVARVLQHLDRAALALPSARRA